MIDSILLQNFQAHEETLLELDKGVNVIVGESDAGKSAILRSIYWTVFGRPSGESIVRQGAKEPCRVVVKTSDGHEIVKVRGCGQNRYEVDGEVYKAFNKAVPEDVTKALNMDRLNFSLQLDPPFLFSMSGGEVAQYMNKLVDLEVVTSSLSRINQMVRRAEDSSRALEASIEQKEDALSKMSWVDKADKFVGRMEAKEKKSSRMKKHLSLLVGALAEYSSALEGLQASAHADKAGRLLSSVQGKVRARKKAADALTWLEDAVESYRDALEGQRASAWVEDAEKAVLRLLKKRDALQKKRTLLAGLEKAVQDYADCVEYLERTAGAYRQNRIQYKKEFPSVCPLCGQAVDKEKI